MGRSRPGHPIEGYARSVIEGDDAALTDREGRPVDDRLAGGLVYRQGGRTVGDGHLAGGDLRQGRQDRTGPRRAAPAEEGRRGHAGQSQSPKSGRAAHGAVLFR